MQRRFLYEEAAEATRRTIGDAGSASRAIEQPSFPFEQLSDIAEVESWRKEIHRPVYHLHKWWAQRLGSVFRALVAGTFAPADADILKLFYEPVRFPGPVVFDPFMGSGTTLGEALKLGCRAIGRDINPVSHFVVRTALRDHRRTEVVQMFDAIERDLAARLRGFFKAQLPDGSLTDALYYFWVKVVPCPHCERPVDLFSSFVFVQHAYASRHPEGRAVCPTCGAIQRVRYDAEDVRCVGCGEGFNPQAGPARGVNASCPGCSRPFVIVEAVRRLRHPPAHRLYAKLILAPDGAKQYLAADGFDRELYAKAVAELKRRPGSYPVASLEPGHNTNQALNYGYRYWHQMFSDRQLLCLGLLADRIRAIESQGLRELFTCLFSGVLEFNNMFASFKGEGTGAVRHMFSHHILKPERTPLEANVWGTPRSSGSFSTLFESRVLRALSYREDPFEIRVVRREGRLRSEKVAGLAAPLGQAIADDYAEFAGGRRVYLSCGDSGSTDLPDGSVDAVITDPPFFDNVHYSQLADFFYVWQRHILGGNGSHHEDTTRHDNEVQHSDGAAFTERLARVWTECHRVLKADGLLVFSYHHSRNEGWRCVLEALMRADFVVVATHPVKAEMSVAAPKQQAREPIDLDVILVCRKSELPEGQDWDMGAIIEESALEAGGQIQRLAAAGRSLSRNDIRVTVMAQVVRRLSRLRLSTDLLDALDAHAATVEVAIDSLQAARRQVPKRSL
jgi:adenine-specific DNA methylase